MKLTVHLAEQSYDIFLTRGCLAEAGRYMNLNRKVLLVTDTGVPQQYADAIAAQCKEAYKVVLPAGEKSKSMDSFSLLLSKMLQASFTRLDCVVAIGGGVMGDLAGFTASCYMRGIDFYNVPTTLLAQVDSSIGGKTAIDFSGIKNSVGSFYQPCAVLADPETLRTLSQRQLYAGLAESIKMAATSDAALFEMIENYSDPSHIADNPDMLEKILYRSLCIKRDVVEKDPKETELRKILNFGHTVGHAIESLHEGEWLHGECIALGMLYMCSKQARVRIQRVLEKYELMRSVKETPSDLLPFILHDKKMKNGKITGVWVDEIGRCELRDFSSEEWVEILSRPIIYNT